MEIVPAPALLTQRAGSLLAAAATPTDFTLDRVVEHAYHGRACTGWQLLDACGGNAADHAFDDSFGSEIHGMPIVAQALDTCSAMGTREDREQRARDRLDLILSAAVAHEFWTGELAGLATADGQPGYTDNPRLQAGGGVTDVHAAGAVGALAGLGLLEGALGTMLSGAPGMIHATREALTTLTGASNNLRVEGDLILTALGTRIAADAGYPGTSPAGAAPAANTSWLYGTARPTIYMGGVDLMETNPAEALDRTVNTLTYHAERPFLVLLECGIVGVRITLAT